MKRFCVFLFFFAHFISTGISQEIPSPPPLGRTAMQRELNTSLQKYLLEPWYPRCIDSAYGGYLSTFTYDFKPTGEQDKMIVTQARHTWTNAKAAERFPAVAHYKTGAEHGFKFLQQVMWDKTYGGFYQLADRQGKVKTDQKTAYGNAFALYVLAAYYHMSKDTAALRLAKESFYWLEKHSHDPIYKGYFQHLQRNGKPEKRTASTPSTSDLGYKDQNSSIHLLEAFTELYAVWPDALVRERVLEMLLLIRDTIVTPKGYMVLFFTPDWKPLSFANTSEENILKHRYLDHVSFGHDVETAYLLMEAAHTIHYKDAQTMIVAKRMVDHSLQNGWDKKWGGFYDEGYYFNNKPGISIIKKSKAWWAQAEGMNTLLLMADEFPRDTANYYEKFESMWRYIVINLVDKEHGGWYEEGLEEEQTAKQRLKGHTWKAMYHEYRSLTGCIDRVIQ